MHVRTRARLCISVVCAGTAVLATAAQSRTGVTPATPLVPIGLTWRNVGPAVTGTRIVDVAPVERDPRIIYVATASSGVWKTTNAGTTWTPLFDRERTVSLGGIAVAPSNPDIVWVATGEPNMRNLRSTTWGDGVYRSVDGGRTWTHQGLADAQHMGRIVVHPADPNVVYASVLGSMWQNDSRKNAVRGLWKTSDGGTTWTKVLSAGAHGGIVDVALDPSAPDTIYAAAWHRERRDWSYVNVGSEGGLYRSTDAGVTWTRLTAGLPAGPIGRPGLAVCRSRPGTVYAVIEGAEGGVFRSTDGGTTWTRRNTMAPSSMYYGQVRCDPRDPERVYVLQTQMSTSTDGGATFDTRIPGRGVHVDHHALWINPADSDHLVLGNDGGVYQSRDRGQTWQFHGQKATTQFYAVATDMREPFYYVYGGTQDNNSLGAPSATRHVDGIVNDDWFVTTGGDGFALAIDPTDPSAVYTEAQYGALVLFNPFTGERRRIQPQPPPGTAYRWNWNAPMRLSPHDPGTFYYGAQFLFRTRDRGATWETVSPDLTRQIPIDPKFRISDYGTLQWIDESPRRQGLLAVGTDDGLIQISQDGGREWRRVDGLPGVPERAQIRRVMFSAHDERTIYAVAAAHEEDDFRPFLLRSTDVGRTWTRIESNLPARSQVLSFVEDPVNPKLLFAGTLFGVFATIDGGASWFSLQLDLPTTAVHDMVIQPRAGDLVIGTHGRGIWILDSLAGLRGLSTVTPATTAALFTPRPAVLLTRFDRGRSSLGDTYFRAPNPPDGAYLDIYLSPTASGAATLEILNAAGERVRRLEAPGGNGLTRVVWDLRGDPAPDAAAGRRGGGGGGGAGAPARGALVAPGTYEARLSVAGTTFRAPVVVRPDPGGR